VRAVDAGFDHHRIPYDAVWLDIDHTHGKRYFTWDPVRFPDPIGLQRHLQDRKRKVGLALALPLSFIHLFCRYFVVILYFVDFWGCVDLLIG